MNNLVKKLIPILAVFGAVLLAIPETKSAGYIILMVLEPLILIFAIVIFKNDIEQKNLKYRKSLINIILINAGVIVMFTLFKIQHWPGKGAILALSALLSLLAILIGLLYLSKNRRELNYLFIYEFILIIFPALLIMWYLIPTKTSTNVSLKYEGVITQSTRTLEGFNTSMIDSNCYFEEYQKLEEIKHYVIEESGGIDEETGMMYGYLNSVDNRFKDRFDFMTFLGTTDINEILKQQLNQVKNAGEVVHILTLMQSDLLLKCEELDSGQ
jgi:hypothetical protein